MIFRQLFESESSTYTYLLADPVTKRALLIDPVIETVERDLRVIAELGLTLAATLDTHVHADHLTGAQRLKNTVGSRIVTPKIACLTCADEGVEDGVPFVLDSIRVLPIHTPGHTSTHFAYLVEHEGVGRLFTGDALLIDGCGRTDFQGGSSAQLYASVRDRLFSLPAETLVYPGHDYQGRWVSSVAQERMRNPRLKDGIDLATFTRIMDELKLPYPKKMDYAVPGNQDCGLCPPNLDPALRLCDVPVQGVFGP